MTNVRDATRQTTVTTFTLILGTEKHVRTKEGFLAFLIVAKRADVWTAQECAPRQSVL